MRTQIVKIISGISSGILPAVNTVSVMCVIKVHIRDGQIWAIEPDDTINPGIAREDGHLPDELIDKCMITARPCTKGYAHIRNLICP